MTNYARSITGGGTMQGGRRAGVTLTCHQRKFAQIKSAGCNDFGSGHSHRSDDDEELVP